MAKRKTAVKKGQSARGSIRDRIVRAVSKARVGEITEQLTNIPSPTGGEAEISDFLAKELERIGLEVSLQEVEEGRNNVIAKLRGKGGGRGRNLMFNAHSIPRPRMLTISPVKCPRPFARGIGSTVSAPRT